ncbi:MAG: hypothetical protein JWN73_1607 [Betaproteobacteria bacterium]|nr:hypothetical protein [Betaproteobacteria bacterium]
MEDDPITIVNMAKAQATLADYELAQEEYRRKVAARAAAKAAGTPSPDDSRQTPKAPRQDPAANISQINKLLARSDISAEDRAMLERRLSEEKIADAFSAR